MRSGPHRLLAALLRRLITLPTVALGLLTPALLPAALAAQGESRAPVPDVVLLRRIAEAVDDYRTGGLVYVVASLAGDHPVAGVFANAEEAAGLAKRLGKEFSTFGPYLAPNDPLVGYTVGCVHVARTSIMRAENNMCVPPRRPVRLTDVKNMSLVLGLADGSSDTLLLPRGTDVVILSLNAFDKFAVPYYLRTLGLAGVAELRAGFAAVYQAGTVPRR